jgi:hypothetical protein
MYHGKMITKKVDHFGDLIPVQKIYTASSCMSGSSEPANMKSSMDCTPEAANFYRTASDKQQYGKAYFRAYCECKNGTISTARAKELIVEMGINHRNYHEYKAPSDPALSKPITDYTLCAISSRGQTNSATTDKFSFIDDDLINAKARSLISDLAANSKNPELKEFATQLDGISGVQNDVDNYRSYFNITPTVDDLQFDKAMTNTAQGIAAAKYLFKLFKNDKEPTPDQKMASRFMWDMRNKIKMIYSESLTIPIFNTYDQKTIRKIEEIERGYYAYDIGTAAERCTIIRYFWTENTYGYSEMVDYYNKVLLWSKREQLEYIDKWQKYADYTHSMYLANSDESFKIRRNILLGKKARCYKSLGNNEKANEILSSMVLNISEIAAIMLMQESFIDGDYEVAGHYYPIVKNYFETEEKSKPIYLFDSNITLNKQTSDAITSAGGSKIETKTIVLHRNDIIMLLATGSYLAIMNRDNSNYKQELAFFELYIEKRPSANYSDEDNEIALSILNGIKSIQLLRENKPQEALILINKALDIKAHTGIAINKSTLWLQQIKFDILVANKQYDQAHNLYAVINWNPMVSNPEYSMFFSSYTLKFKKCELLYEQGEYQRVLNGLDLLEAIKPKQKYNLMRSKVYDAMGEYEKSRKELTKI